MKWEYTETSGWTSNIGNREWNVEGDRKERLQGLSVTTVLNMYGEQGRELIAVRAFETAASANPSTFYYFKRPR